MNQTDPLDNPEALAQLFHETYERLAPDFGYETRKDSAVPWAEVPDKNRALMTMVASHIQAAINAEIAKQMAAYQKELMTDYERDVREARVDEWDYIETLIDTAAEAMSESRADRLAQLKEDGE